MAEQKALVLESKKGSFVLANRPIPKPGLGELLVKIHATGLNPADWKIQEYGLFIEDFPAVLGSDGAGEVEAIGEGVEGWTKGDRVLFQGFFFSNDQTTFQQYALVPAEIAAKIPANVSYSQAASIPVGFATAAVGLYADRPAGAGSIRPWDVRPKYPPQPAIVIGASTCIGQFVVQLLKYSGYGPIIVYASAHNFEYLKTLGAGLLIDRNVTPIDHLVSTLNHLNSTPIHMVFDCIGSQDAQEHGYRCLSGGGILVTVLEDKIRKEVRGDGRIVITPYGSVHIPTNRPFGKIIFQHLTRFLEEGIIQPNRVEDLPNGLEGIVGGLEKLRKNLVSGVKLVAHPQDTT